MMLSLTVLAFADEIDCRSISKEERDAIGAADSDILIRIYNGSFLHGFAICDSIDDLTSSKYVLEEILLSYRQDDYSSVACYRINNSVANKVNGLESASLIFAQYTSESTVDKLEKKTKATIRSIICLCGETSRDGIYIYYKTDNGDFVLFKEYASSDKVYFFPVSEFITFTKDFLEKKTTVLYDQNGEVRKGTSVRLEDVVNVKKYELSLNNSVEWFIIITIVLSGLAVVFVSIIVIRKVRRKKTGDG